MYRYRFHGVLVLSDLTLPGLPEDGGEPLASEAIIRLVLGSGSLLERLPVSDYRIEADEDDRHRLLIPEGAVVEIDTTGGIRVDASPAMPVDLLEHILIGQALPNALALLGFTCLHASCLQLDGGAVAVVGDQGAGKSSVAAAWLCSGRLVLADDCTVLASSQQDGALRWMVQPGPGRLKLWPDTIGTLRLSDRLRRPVYAGADKQVLVELPIGRRTPLASIVLLSSSSEASKPSERALSLPEALPRLFGNTFGHRRRSREGRALHFQQLTQVLLSVPVREWSVPRSLANLPQTIATLVGLERLHAGEHLAPS